HDRTVAISPIVGGRALKGPTVEMMVALRGEATPSRVAEEYRRFAGGFVVDTLDEVQVPAIQALGYQVLVTDTVMDDVEGARKLAATLRGSGGWGNGRQLVSRGAAGDPESLAHLLGPERALEPLLSAAHQVRLEGHGQRISYSPKAFLPLTQLCRDNCGYCT